MNEQNQTLDQSGDVATTSVPSYAFSLLNNTALGTGYKLLVLGYSVASELYLQPDTSSSLKWGNFPSSLIQSLTTVNSSSSITTNALSKFSRISTGDQVSGTGITAGTTVSALSADIEMEQAATASATTTTTVTLNVVLMVGGNATSGSNTITGIAPPPSLSNVRLGQIVEGKGIPAGTTVTEVTKTGVVTMSNSATETIAYSGTEPLNFQQQYSGNPTSGSKTLTITGLSSSDQVNEDMLISGTGIPTNTIISTINDITITLSADASENGTADLTFSQEQTGTWTAGNTLLTGLASTKDHGVGHPLLGTGIAPNTTIVEINSSTEITLSTAPTAAGAAQSLTFPPPSGVVPSFDIETFTSFAFDAATQTNGLNGARIYFFAVPSSWPASGTDLAVLGFPTNPAAFPYSWSGTGFGLEQPNNPPNMPLSTSGYPPYAIVEPTIDPSAKGGLLHIDVQTVDGFSFPLTITLEDSAGTQTGQVGQPVPDNGITRADIISAFQATFVSPSPYADLMCGTSTDIDGQYAGILNPGLFTTGVNPPTSALNTLWDPTLETLFTNIGYLNMVGDDGDYYQGKPSTVTLAGATCNVLNFIGYSDTAMTTANGNVFNIFDPKTPDTGAPNYNFSSGFQVFANTGVFADSSPNVLIQQNSNVLTTPVEVAVGLQRDIVCALNRGIALASPTAVQSADVTRTAGDNSLYWGTETNWYPYTTDQYTEPQNQFSLFMHTAAISEPARDIDGLTIPAVVTPIFTQPPSPVKAANGSVMGQAYGFAFDESPVHGPAITQPNVPSKYDPVPLGTKTITITAGKWS